MATNLTAQMTENLGCGKQLIKFTKEEIENLNSFISIKLVESFQERIIKILSKMNTLGLNCFTSEFYQTLKEKNKTNFIQTPTENRGSGNTTHFIL